jgi:hypothetical protein
MTAPARLPCWARPTYDGVPDGYGLALLRDQNVLSTESSNLMPFDPVGLAPGASIPVAFLNVAPPCADPHATVPLGSKGAAGYRLIYETLGWRRIGVVWPHVSVTVAGCE